MEENKLNLADPRPPLAKTAAENGALITGILIIYSMLLYLLDLNKEQWLGMVGMVIMIALMFVFGRRYSESGGRTELSYGRAFKFLAILVFVSAVLSAVFNYIYFEFISPETIDFSIQQSYDQMIERGLSESQAEAQLKFVLPWMSSISFTLVGMVMTVFWGLLASLIIAVMMKKEPTSI